MALLHMDFFSEVLGMCCQADVILPQKTRAQIGMKGNAADTYPTLYLLHGLSDDHTIWQRRTSIERYVSELGIAVVMPCVHRSWYTNSDAGRYFSYIAKELPAICRDFFPKMSDKREETWIAGLSMGGYGAFKAALAHPKTFGAAASLSGAFLFCGTEPFSKEFSLFLGNKREGSENDLRYLADQLAEKGGPFPRLFQWCGTEDGLLDGNREFKAHLEALGYPDLTYSESEGNHSWPYWDAQIQNVIKWLTNK